MTTVEIHKPGGGSAGSMELPAEVFDVAENKPLMHQVVVAQLAAARQGTHKTKTRGEARGGGRKPYRQKGTGRARQGSTRSPQYAGGGIAHGPVPRDYSQRTPKKMKAAALRGALSDRARGGRVHVISEIVAGPKPSTKSARAVITALSGRPRVLVVVGRDDEVSWLSLRNLANVHVIAADQLNTYDVLVNDDVVFTIEALNAFLAGPVASKSTVQAPAAPAARARAQATDATDATADTTDTTAHTTDTTADAEAPAAAGSAPAGASAASQQEEDQ